MNCEREMLLLKDAFKDFIAKILPGIEEGVKAVIKERWATFEEIMLNPIKSSLDLYLYVSRMTYLAKDSKPNSDVSVRIRTDSDKK